jgi:hypothetical protein
MTFDEHMYVKDLLLDVRDALDDRCRHDEGIRLLVQKLEDCLAVLHRPHVRHALTADVPVQQACRATTPLEVTP